MTSNRRLLASMALGLALALGLVACAGVAAPTTAQEVAERYSAYEGKGNYHMDMVQSMALKLGETSTSIDTNMAYDVDDDNIHGTATVTSDLLGIDAEQEMETYVAAEDEQYVMYVSSDGGTSWTKSEVDASNLPTHAITLDADKLGAAEFTQTDDGYELTGSGIDLLVDASALSLGQLTGSDFGDLFKGAVDDALQNAKITYRFDKDCHLVGMDLKMTFDVAGDDSVLPMDISMDIDMTATISGYGSVDADSVAVPQSVRDAAVEGDPSSLGV